jgi:hypothetical protein
MIAWVACALFSLLCFVRKIEIFAATHLFADVMIVLTMLTIVVYGIINMKTEH